MNWEVDRSRAPSYDKNYKKQATCIAIPSALVV